MNAHPTQDSAHPRAAGAQNGPLRVMTVCTGNICRSAMAQVVLRDRFKAAGLADQVVVDSTGVSAEESGNPMDRRARSVLLDHGYDVDGNHQARQVRRAELADQDLVLAMTAQHAHALRRLWTDDPRPADERGVLRMYRSFDPSAPVIGPGVPEHDLDIADPWYGGRQDFEDCLAQIEAGADGIVEYVQDRLRRK